MTANIHPSAIVEKSVQLGTNVEIGPFCHVSGNVTLDDEVKLHSHVVITGNTTIGKGTVIYPFASLGHRPQDLKYQGEPSTLTIGEKNMIREYVTMQPGTEGGGMKTLVGNNGLYMASCHVAHDCIIGNNVIMANNATLAGHVVVEDFAIIGGLAAVLQFVRIGRYAIVGGMSGVSHDVPPYASVRGEHAFLSGLNLVGLRRRGATRDEIQALQDAYQKIYSPLGTLEERIKKLVAESTNDKVSEVVQFIMKDTKRKLCAPKNGLDELAAS
ncbi:acyl-ACP--UDP-N-acetylglucosamine O-acyltransferase [Candidatus Nucleicultrix amoebiphila]|uniref:Acyl-[acyl-carrier-protein]--UDP-N-acetylglucosamine O-acyltransferase n=1 Tax=Candidatus Nucleicultrix amoebiphila FS5 TaxID=1414854 RepID=A0A1W6N373_9PROT|nr:acyl-ACP--UDP-N-acetylglucosamine O-acyltransferase [Candidatus Nucleicultrix amoebiphila]ARN84201.1 UDP-N-acetylglucosamine acyltransferase [Candidatus Nucleicultrix amoebiphila FS5]